MTALEIVKAAAERASLKSRPAQREAAQAKAEQAKSRFEEDFEMVAEFYKLRECGQYEQALDVSKRDVVGAKRCYHAIANSLRRENTAAGITERIQARIAQEQKVGLGLTHNV